MHTRLLYQFIYLMLELCSEKINWRSNCELIKVIRFIIIFCVYSTKYNTIAIYLLQTLQWENNVTENNEAVAPGSGRRTEELPRQQAVSFVRLCYTYKYYQGCHTRVSTHKSTECEKLTTFFAFFKEKLTMNGGWKKSVWWVNFLSSAI